MRLLRFKIGLILVCWSCLWGISTASAKDFVVVIDAGHGGHDAGAVGKTSKEKNINLKVALAVGRLIAQKDKEVRVLYTRQKDVFVTLQERANIANRNKADLFISIHTNALPKGRIVQGTETYTLGLHRTQENLEVAQKENSVILIEDDYKTRYAGFNPNSSESYIMFEFMQDKNMEQSVQLATLIQQQFKKTAKRVDRGVRQAGFLVLHATTMPSVLVELGYISTPAEERYLNSQAGVDALSRSICQAVLTYKNGHSVSDESLPMLETPQIDQTLQPDKAVAEKKTSTLKPASTKESSASETVTKVETDNRPVFKIQILTSGTVLKKNDRRLKGLSPVQYYKENGLYKYTYGESTDYNEILRLRKKVSSSFKDAFIIAFRKGEKMNVQEAIQEFKRNR